ncbi:MAG TPA: DedA family protein, partial [Anaeromyxobacteraceae bacterium]|nr:DedA family protein [Anaeromyxobacteraceae bacterium]
MLLAFLTHFGYAALVLLLVAGGLGVPVPEELIQLTAGYLARRGLFSLAPAVGLTWLGLVTGDYLLFRLGRALGPRVLDTPRVARVLTPARRAFLERHFARHALLTIVVARHASGLRVPVFAMAGASGVRSRTFLVADGLSALASVPLVVGAGWLLAGHIEEAKKQVREVELVVLAAVLLGLGAWALLRRRQAR